MIRLFSFAASIAGCVLLAIAGVDWRGATGVWLIVLAWHLGELANEERRARIRRDEANDNWVFRGDRR